MFRTNNNKVVDNSNSAKADKMVEICQVQKVENPYKLAKSKKHQNFCKSQRFETTYRSKLQN